MSQKNESRVRRVAVLGSTGSIGVQTLDVAARLGSERLKVVGLAARRNISLLARQAQIPGVRHVVATDSAAFGELESALRGSDIRIGYGPEAMTELAGDPDSDTVVIAVAGAAGLEATLAACRAGKRVCLATKEALVAAGDLVIETARKHGAELLPIDSEHSALFQCLQGYRPEQVAALHLTASGGPFRAWDAQRIESATIEDALKHPTWNMGGKITIDSATLMNKGLEVIEACHLFQMPVEKVKVVVHPQSVIHSFVELTDGALLAQLGLPDMRLPIQIALLYPEKPDTGLPRLNLTDIAPLTFEEPDHVRFPALNLAREAFRRGGTAPAILNAANEAAVAAFLEGRIRFVEICRWVADALDALPQSPADSLPIILNADASARKYIYNKVGMGTISA